jgi:hypothetical protein
MDRGPDAHPSTLAPVPAYPRRAVEQYLAEVRASWDDLQGTLQLERNRHQAALDALAAADESHRVLGAMMVEAQQDMSARRAHASEAVASLLASADDEATRILQSARRQAMAILGQPEPDPEPETGDDHGSTSDDEPEWPSRPSPPTRPARAASAVEATIGPVADDEPAVHAVAAVDLPSESMELWPSRRPASIALDSLRWRPRWRRPQEPEWPVNAGDADESYFTRLRDEFRADGTINAWFEPA